MSCVDRFIIHCPYYGGSTRMSVTYINLVQHVLVHTVLYYMYSVCAGTLTLHLSCSCSLTERYCECLYLCIHTCMCSSPQLSKPWKWLCFLPHKHHQAYSWQRWPETWVCHPTLPQGSPWWIRPIKKGLPRHLDAVHTQAWIPRCYSTRYIVYVHVHVHVCAWYIYMYLYMNSRDIWLL